MNARFRVVVARVFAAVLGFACSGREPLRAADWPTYQANYSRNAYTPDLIPLAAEKPFAVAWSWSSSERPQPAWPQPAKWDSYKWIRGLKSMRNYDPVFHLTLAQGLVFFGSSVDDCVHALDAQTGVARWTFPTEGPVRVAPAVVEGRVYFGSDDGFAYCVEAATGKLIWKFSPQPNARKVLNNGKLISFWPVRTGVVVDGGVAYFGASMLPWKTSYLCAVDALTGSPSGAGRYVQELAGQSIEGPFAASAKHLVMPQGRVPPRVYARANGEDKGALGGGGGSFVLLTDDNLILHGPGNLTGRVVASQVASRTQLASFDQANAIVVIGSMAYVLTDSTLSATKRSTREVKWTVDCGYPFALIGAGDFLFVGGVDGVAAYGSIDGKKRWSGAVDGKVYGLAAADGRLYVSTDVGKIYCFSVPTGAIAKTAAPGQSSGSPVGQPFWKETPPPVAAKPAPGAAGTLLHDWLMDRRLLRAGADQTPIWPLRDGRVRELGPRQLEAQVAGIAEVQRVGDGFALKLDGKATFLRVDPALDAGQLPTQAMSVEVWAQLDRFGKELSLVSLLGTNSGTGELGWSLEMREDRLRLGLSSTATKERLELLSTVPCRTNQWQYLVATFDGKWLRLFVDGEAAGAREVPAGAIGYAAKTSYEIGRYSLGAKPAFLSGLLHRVTIRDHALDPLVIWNQFNDGRRKFYGGSSLAAGPALQFISPSEAVVRWTTRAPVPTVLEYDLNGVGFRHENPAAATQHQVTLTGLRYDRIYSYAIGVRDEASTSSRFTREFECDTYFNYSPTRIGKSAEPVPSNAPATPKLIDLVPELAEARGLAVVLGLNEGEWVTELCRSTDYRIIGLDVDESRVERLRARLLAAGLYGPRVSLQRVGRLDSTALPGHFANLVVSESLARDRKFPAAPVEVQRLLKPGAGFALFGIPAAAPASLRESLESILRGAGVDFRELTRAAGTWLRVDREELPGAGEWTHQYGGPDNSAFGGEALLGARTVDELEVQWLGEPGPRYQDDRNGRNAAPLAVNGRLFCQGLERVVCVDAHNGTILWSVETPDFMRYNVPRDSANWCADHDSLYLAILGQCWRIDQKTGQVEVRFTVPAGPRVDWNYDWGFIAREGDRLIGSGVKAGTAARDFWGGIGWYDAPGGPQAAKVCSDHVFSCDPRSGSVHWTYRQGLVLNSTITTSKGRIYFLENRAPELREDSQRWIQSPRLWQDLRLVALDAAKGGVVLDKPLEIVPGDAVVYLAEGQGKLVIVSSHQATSSYYVYVLDAASGELMWRTDFKWMNGDHGGHMSRPAIVGNRLFVRPQVFDLHSGAEIPGLKMSGGGCGSYAASANALFFRSGNISMWETDQSRQTSWARMRPDCWISTLPALGMVLSPEGGGGCSCGNWMETSAAFLPDAQQSRLLKAMAETHETRPVKRFQKLLHHSEADLRVASLRALGSTRYADDAWEATPDLLRISVSGGSEAERVAARGTLRLLESPKVNEMLTQLLEHADPLLRVEAIQALGDRGCASAMPQLLQAARDADAQVRRAALRALPQAGLARHYPAVVGLLSTAESPEDLAAIRTTVQLTARRVQDLAARSRPVLELLPRTQQPAAKAECLTLLGGFGGDEAFQAIRRFVVDPEALVREAAWAAVATWPNPEAFEPLVSLVQETSDETNRARAIAGAVRVLFLSQQSRASQEMLNAHTRLMALAGNVAQKVPVFEGLARLESLAALRYLVPWLERPDSQTAAAKALIALSKTVGEAHPEPVREALQQVRWTVRDEPVVASAGEALNHLERFEDYLSQWRVAGPFTRPIGNQEPLLSVAFAPEGASAASVGWRDVQTEQAPRAPGLLNLAARFGETNSCAYVQTRLYVPQAMSVVFQVATDESYRLWVNSVSIQETNLEKPRRATSKSDRLVVKLKEGWNTVQIKSLQSGGDWQVGCRVRGVDGCRVKGLQSGF